MAKSVEQLCAIILAGGKSTRFGADKASALLAGRPLLEWVASAVAAAGCDPIIVVRARGQQLPPVSVSLFVVEDFLDGAGPLAGLVAGLRAATTDFAFVTSCDAPLLQPSIVRLLAAHTARADVVCPVVDGHAQPLVAIYRTAACLPAFGAALADGVSSLKGAVARIRVSEIDESTLRGVDPELKSFRNANRPEVLAEMERELGQSP